MANNYNLNYLIFYDFSWTLTFAFDSLFFPNTGFAWVLIRNRMKSKRERGQRHKSSGCEFMTLPAKSPGSRSLPAASTAGGLQMKATRRPGWMCLQSQRGSHGERDWEHKANKQLTAKRGHCEKSPETLQPLNCLPQVYLPKSFMSITAC